MVKEEGTCGQPNDAQHAVQRLRKHALNFSAHKAGGRQI